MRFPYCPFIIVNKVSRKASFSGSKKCIWSATYKAIFKFFGFPKAEITGVDSRKLKALLYFLLDVHKELAYSQILTENMSFDLSNINLFL